MQINFNKKLKNIDNDLNRQQNKLTSDARKRIAEREEQKKQKIKNYKIGVNKYLNLNPEYEYLENLPIIEGEYLELSNMEKGNILTNSIKKRQKEKEEKEEKNRLIQQEKGKREKEIQQLIDLHKNILDTNKNNLRKSENIKFNSIKDKQVKEKDFKNIIPIFNIYYTIDNYRDNNNNLIIYEGQFKKITYDNDFNYLLINNYLIGINNKINDKITIYKGFPMTIVDIKKQLIENYLIKNNSIIVKNNSIVVKNKKIQDLVKIKEFVKEDNRLSRLIFENIQNIQNKQYKISENYWNIRDNYKVYLDENILLEKFLRGRELYYTIDGIKDNNNNKIFQENIKIYNLDKSKRYICSNNSIFGIREAISIEPKSVGYYLVPKEVTFYESKY